MKEIRISFIDITHPHVWTRADILREMEGVDLHSVWEPRTETGPRRSPIGTASPSPIPRQEFILRIRRVDAVVIESYTQSHADLTIKALKAGKAVLLEKPGFEQRGRTCGASSMPRDRARPSCRSAT